ncbi:MAG: hypothetical protein IPJ31_06570 [Bacteroidetes bacterium]|nr:hypothetical protein [Bacteroidota bacterium]
MGPGGSQTFNYTGSVQNFTVPVGITSINIDARGAQGGTFGNAIGGLGAKMVGDVSVLPGQVLSVWVGQQGVPSQNAGGGGGGSGVTNGATPLVIAGGGGGGCSVNMESGKPGLITTSGGNSSGAGGVAGDGGQKGYVPGDCGWAGGGGGFLGDGNGGPSGGDGGPLPGTLGGPAAGKSAANGGAGGIGGSCGFSLLGAGGWGCGGGGRAEYGGGGGGGYSGGGGGQYVAVVGSKGGGGGGSFNSGINQVNTSGVQSGNGQVIITWGGVAPCFSVRVPVTVTVNAAPTVTATASADSICVGGSSVLTGGGAVSYVWNPGGLVGSPTVTPAVTTTYTVTGTNATGCTATATVMVTVNNTCCDGYSKSFHYLCRCFISANWRGCRYLYLESGWFGGQSNRDSCHHYYLYGNRICRCWLFSHFYSNSYCKPCTSSHCECITCKYLCGRFYCSYWRRRCYLFMESWRLGRQSHSKSFGYHNVYSNRQCCRWLHSYFGSYCDSKPRY